MSVAKSISFLESTLAQVEKMAAEKKQPTSSIVGQLLLSAIKLDPEIRKQEFLEQLRAGARGLNDLGISSEAIISWTKAAVGA